MSRNGSDADGSGCLIDQYDALLLDLDGTLSLGGQPISHATEAMQAALDRGCRLMVVTNNASRSPEQVSHTLQTLGIDIAPRDIVTSSQVASTMLADSHPSGSPILVVGAQALCETVAAVGLRPVREAGENPVAVVQGHSPETGWRQLAEACIAVRGGADWVATNDDLTLPSDRGELPGNGAMVAALIAATGRRPRVAGKPAPPLLEEAVARSGATRPLVIGDRLETDIEAAVAAGLPSLLVLTGASTAADLLAAATNRRPTYLCRDLRGLTSSGRTVALQGEDADTGLAWRGWSVTVNEDHLTLAVSGNDSAPGTDSARGNDSAPGNELTPANDPAHGSDMAPGHATTSDEVGRDRTLAALAALARAAWESGVTAVRADGQLAADALRELGL